MTTQIATRGRLAVSLPCHGAEQPTTMWLYLITFGKQHEELAKHKKRRSGTGARELAGKQVSGQVRTTERGLATADTKHYQLKNRAMTSRMLPSLLRVTTTTAQTTQLDKEKNDVMIKS